jgi:Tat protein secretion system quality control protein TatD with DNase activity
MIRGRNEPCNIKQVVEVVSSVLGLSEEEVANKAYQNTLEMFNLL